LKILEKFLGIILFAAMIAALYAVFIIAPTETTMGHVQRIFYFHVASAWISFLAFFVVFISSLLFLLLRKECYDHCAAASAETGVLFSSFVLTTGPLWAKPVWGIWWTWDARLTSTFILWLIYISYLMLRSFVTPEHKKKVLSAVVGIVGFMDVPVSYLSIRWWRTQHPSPVIAGGEGSGIDPVMLKVLLFSVFVFMLLYFCLARLRISIARCDSEIHFLQQSRRRTS
jgi:heme exporter protein C